MKTINASQFKARCLAILKHLHRTGEAVTILHRGRPIAQLVAPTACARGFPQDQLRGTIEIMGDILEPVLPAESWEAQRKARK